LAGWQLTRTIYLITFPFFHLWPAASAIVGRNTNTHAPLHSLIARCRTGTPGLPWCPIAFAYFEKIKREIETKSLTV